MEHKQLRVLLPAELVDAVYAAAHAEGKTLSEYVGERLRSALGRKQRRAADK